MLESIRMVRVNIEDMYSLENIPYPFLEAMSEFDKMEVEESEK